jgi:serine/threonine protein phosphatase PrpC
VLFFSHSLRNPTKANCGDHSYAGEITIDNKAYTLLLVADGISSAGADYIASATAIKEIVNYLESSKKVDPENTINTVIIEAIYHANDVILSGTAGPSTMKTTLSLLLIDAEDVYMANAGDSRIYGFENGTWTQLTVDDAQSQKVMENGKSKLYGGSPIIVQALNKYLGLQNLVCDVIEIPIEKYTGYVLMSDGLYTLAQWEEYTNDIFNTLDMNETFEKNKTSLNDQIKDDASIAIYKSNIKSTIDFKSNELNQYSKAVYYEYFNATLESFIEKKDIESINSVIEIMIKNHFINNKPNAVKLLDKILAAGAKDAGGKLVMEIRKL